MSGQPRRYILSGRPEDLAAHEGHPCLAGYVQTVLTDRPEVADAWITEEALTAWRHLGSPLLPSPELVAAGGDMDLLRQVGRVVGEMLRAWGFGGVWGSPLGLLSNSALPWMDDVLIEPLVAGLGSFGIDAAWYDGASLSWHTGPWGRVTRGGSGGGSGVWYVTAYELASATATDDGPGTRGQREDRTEPLPSLTILGDRLADRGITLIDDPGLLPLNHECVVTVEDPTGTGASAGLGTVWPQNANRRQPFVGQGGRALVWVDAKGRDPEDGEVLVAVSCKRPEFIAEMPRQAVKIAVYDDWPEMWHQLLRKLRGESPWNGRLPREIKAQSPATHQSHYATEQPHVHPSLRALEGKATIPLVRSMMQEEVRSVRRLVDLAPAIARAVEVVREAWRQGHHLFYVGAGSAGRMGMLDAAEIPPTFGVPREWAQAIMAGGPEAFRRAREGVEDDAAEGRWDVAAHNLAQGDVLLAITAHGNTPYVLGAAEEACRVGATVIGIVNNSGTALAQLSDIVVEVPSGPEVLVGSTRLKAGTSEKLVLNTISTLGMVGVGRTYDNLMVDFVPSNEKLKERAIRVCMMATGSDRNVATKLVDLARGHLKVAIVAGKLSVTVEEAEELVRVHGSVAAAIHNEVKEFS